jgi:hypothetical protein
MVRQKHSSTVLFLGHKRASTSLMPAMHGIEEWLIEKIRMLDRMYKT